MKHLKKTANSFVILITCCIIFSVSVFLIFSCTLLNPAFFEDVINNTHIVNSIETAADYMAQNGIIIETQSVKDNLISLIGGIIRYITQEDMSFSNITLDNRYAESLRASILAEASDRTQDIPDILRIHPYMLSYFISGSEAIYFNLQLIRNSYSLFHALCPVLVLLTLFIFLLTKKPGKHICRAFTASSLLLVAFGLFIRLFQNPLFISPVESISSDLAMLSKPVILKIANEVSLYFFAAGIIFIAVSLIFRLKPFYDMQNKIPVKVTVLLILFSVMFFMLYRYDAYSGVIYNAEYTSPLRNVSTLAQNDGAVHSLVLKLKEQETDRPVKDVKLIVNKIDYPYNPLYVSDFSDERGDTRFILPSGSFLVYADESTLPFFLSPFEPVIIQLNNPGNSWYSIYMTKEERPKAPVVIQSGKPVPYPY